MRPIRGPPRMGHMPSSGNCRDKKAIDEAAPGSGDRPAPGQNESSAGVDAPRLPSINRDAQKATGARHRTKHDTAKKRRGMLQFSDKKS